MFDWLAWFTHLENSKIFALVLFFLTFCGILFYVFTGKKRTKRLESYKHIPFQDEEETSPNSHSRKVKDNERENK